MLIYPPPPPLLLFPTMQALSDCLPAAAPETINGRLAVGTAKQLLMLWRPRAAS